MNKTRISHYKIRIPDRYGSPERPFRAVFLSDLHDRALAGDERFWQVIEKTDPAMIFCGGDMLTAGRRKKGHAQNALDLMKKLAAGHDVYAVNGNHESRAKADPVRYKIDYPAFEQELRDAGITILNNDSVTVSIGGIDISIAGFELDKEAYNRAHPVLPGPEDIRLALGEKDLETYTILLAHHPDAIDAYSGWGSDLVLSGHIHGGLIVLPFLGGVAGGSFRLFPKYCRGSFREGQTRMIVTAGIGEHTPMLRMNNPYEIVVLEFYPE